MWLNWLRTVQFVILQVRAATAGSVCCCMAGWAIVCLWVLIFEGQCMWLFFPPPEI